MNLRDTHTSTIQKGDVAELLLFHDKHFYVEALALPQDHKLNYGCATCRENCSATQRLSTTPPETEKYMSKLVKHNYPKAASHRSYLQKKNDYYMSWHSNPIAVGARFANVQKVDQPTTNDNPRTQRV